MDNDSYYLIIYLLLEFTLLAVVQHIYRYIYYFPILLSDYLTYFANNIKRTFLKSTWVLTLTYCFWYINYFYIHFRNRSWFSCNIIRVSDFFFFNEHNKILQKNTFQGVEGVPGEQGQPGEKGDNAFISVSDIKTTKGEPGQRGDPGR